MMRKLASLFVLAAAFVACSKNPITGRNQAHLVSEQELQSMATQQYQQFLSENKVVAPSAARDAEMVRRVGNRVASAVNQYFKDHGQGTALEGYKWEFNLVNNQE